MGNASADRALWYFAYGSNLDPGTFLGRRQMRPTAAAIARLDGWRLCFDLPVGPGERGVGNVHPDPTAHLWGVAYEIAPDEAGRLDRSEGVGRGAYRRVPVTVETPAGASIESFTYHAPRGVEGRKPSRRYLGLLLTGARHHALPHRYVERLRAIPLAVDERDTQLELPL